MMNTVPITKEFVLLYSSPLFMKAQLNKETHIFHKSKKLLTLLKENPSLSYGLKEVNNMNTKNHSKLEDPDSPLFLPLPLKNPNMLFLCNLLELKTFKHLSPKSEVVNKYSAISKILPQSKPLLNGWKR